MRQYVFRIFSIASCLLAFGGSNVIAGVWSEELSGDRGDPVRFCINDICEQSRYVLKGSARSWTFFELANGYREDRHTSELTNVITLTAQLDGEEISPEHYATIRLESGYHEETLVQTDSSGHYLNVEGRITNEMLAEFEQVVSSSPNLVGISLQSPGGNAEIALSMAEIIFNRGLSTFIAKDSYCSAACSTVFLSGYDRVVKGYLEISPLISTSSDQKEIRRKQVQLLYDADNDLNILELVRSLNWNQYYRVDDPRPFERDLPGDATTRN